VLHTERTVMGLCAILVSSDESRGLNHTPGAANRQSTVEIGP
jgi:hypothetical protein